MSNKISSHPKVADGEPAANPAGAQPQVEVVRALRMGWLTSEVYGLVRHGALDYAPRRRPQDQRTGRLAASDRDLKSDTLRLELDMRALLRLAKLLQVYDPAKEDAPLHRLAGRLLDFLAGPRESQPPTLGEVHAGLEVWSMETWSALIARNELAARAFSYGASIGDTFWFMRRPNSKRPPQSERETWEGLLRAARLREQSERIGELEAHLPPHVAVALKHSLLKWGVAGRLKKIAKPTGENAQPQEEDAQPKGENKKNKKAMLDPEIERQVFLNLSSQARVWRSIILGERTPESYLERNDVRWIGVLHNGSFALLSVLMLFILFSLIWIVISVVGPLFFRSVWDLILNLQPAGKTPSLELKDVISSLSILAALLAGLWAAGRWMFEQQFRLYEWVGRKARERYIKRHTWVSWNRPTTAPNPPLSVKPEDANEQ